MIAYPAMGGPAGTAVSYQVSTAAQRDALSYWIPSRMTAATAGTGTITQRPAASTGTITRQSAAVPPTEIPTAATFRGVPTTGALFYTIGAGRHFCTASVVDSPTGNLVLTAAHCVYSVAHGYAQHIEYVPEYHAGHEPYGTWPVATITVASGWKKSANPNYDFAFLTVAPAATASPATASPVNGTAPVQSRTGGLSLGTRLPYTEQNVEVVGYNDVGNGPVRCAVRSLPFRVGQREFYCRDYRDGTSGSPWILHYDKASGTGTVIGVIGGYQAGGNYAWASYSAYFGSDAENLYKRAEASSTAPVPAPAVTTRITRAPRLQGTFTPRLQSTFVPYISPSGSASNSRRTPSGSLK